MRDSRWFEKAFFHLCVTFHAVECLRVGNKVHGRIIIISLHFISSQKACGGTVTPKGSTCHAHL